MTDMIEERRVAPRKMPSPVALAVREGLSKTPKTLPPWLFYDDAGSALFEKITELPEYYPTRTERAIFAERGRELMRLGMSNADTTIVELGAGTSTKTQVLLEHTVELFGAARYVPLDVSRAPLEEAKLRLRRDLPQVHVEPAVVANEDVTRVLSGIPARKLVLFIGSSLGNYERPDAEALLRSIRAGMGPGDRLLLGVDFRKSKDVLIPAYDDSAGVTAAFNLNVLRRINRDLGGRFVLPRFQHVAVWNEAESRIEMHLESTVDQDVAISGLDMTIHLGAGERIHTESSIKYDERRINALFAAAGLRRTHLETDERAWFGVFLAAPSLR